MARLLATLLALLWLLMMFIPTPNLTALDLSQSVYEFSQDLDIDELWEEWLEPGQYMTMLTPEGEVITQTGRRIYEGDEYLTSDNRFYRVVKVEDTLAYTELVEEKVDLAAEFISLRQIREALGLSAAQAQENGNEPNRHLSYPTMLNPIFPPTVPTVLTAKAASMLSAVVLPSPGKAGCRRGILENLHLPHDRGAYRRSAALLDLLAKIRRHLRCPLATQRRKTHMLQTSAMNGSPRFNSLWKAESNLGVNRQYAQSLKSPRINIPGW